MPFNFELCHFLRQSELIATWQILPNQVRAGHIFEGGKVVKYSHNWLVEIISVK